MPQPRYILQCNTLDFYHNKPIAVVIKKLKNDVVNKTYHLDEYVDSEKVEREFDDKAFLLSNESGNMTIRFGNRHAFKIVIYRSSYTSGQLTFELFFSVDNKFINKECTKYIITEIPTNVET